MYIYKVINRETGQWYVGKRTLKIDTADYEKYYGTGTNIKKALALLGKSAFTKIVLEDCTGKTKEYLAERELYWINRELNISNNTYNKQTKHNNTGNSGGYSQTEEHVRKRIISRQLNKNPLSQESRRRMSEARKNKPSKNKGKKYPKMSQERLGSANPAARKVIYIETGETFGSLSEAALKFGINRKTLCCQLRRKSKCCKFIYFD